MPVTLPNFLRINDARRRKFELLASLTPLEIDLLDVAAAGTRGGAHVFGYQPGKHDPHEESRGRILITYPSRRVSARKSVNDERLLEDGQPVLDRLVRAGWLRFAPAIGTLSSMGYFWLTDASQRLWELLDRPPKSPWWVNVPSPK